MPLTKDQIEFLKKHINSIVLHWSAGSYSWTSPKYHFNVTYDGKLGHLKQTKSIYEIGEHCWKRNTGKIGVTMCAMLTDPRTKKVLCPPEDHQIEVYAKTVAELCFILDIDINGVHLDNEKYYDKKNKTLVNTGKKIEFPNVTDHAYYARKDGYYPDRVDIGSLLPVVIGKARWYLARLKNGTDKIMLLNNLK